MGFVYGIPGFFTITAKSSSKSSRGCPPVTTLIPSSSKLWAAGFSSKAFPSFTVTIAPRRSSKRAADSPDFANPKTRTFLFLNVSMMFIAFLLQFVHLLFYPFLDNLKSLKTAKEATPYKNDLFPFFHKKVAMILHHNDSISGVKISSLF